MLQNAKDVIESECNTEVAMETKRWSDFVECIIGAVTHTMVNAIFHGKLSRDASYLGFSITC